MYGVHAMLVQSAPHVDSASARSGMLVFLVRLPYCFCLSSWVPTVIFLLLPHTQICRAGNGSCDGSKRWIVQKGGLKI